MWWFSSRGLCPNCGLFVRSLTVVLACLVPIPSADATTCIDICPDPGACTINTLKSIDPGSDIACTDRDLHVTDNGSLRVIDGDMRLVAHNLTVDGPGGTIYAVEGNAHIRGEIEIELTGDLQLSGKVRANGNTGGGSIRITADGDISIPQNGTDGVEADGTSAAARGGTILIEAGGALSIMDPIHTAGATSGQSSGGTVAIRAIGNITVGQDGHIGAPGRTAGGGTVTIQSQDGDVVLDEHVVVDGEGSVGDGGKIEISAGYAVQITQPIYARGGVNASGGQARGGSVEIEAGCGGVAINGSISTTGGQLGSAYDSGSIMVSSLGNIAVAAGVVLDAHALASGGSGGTIELRTRDLVSIAGGATLDSRGSSAADGNGGDVRLTGCRVSVAPSAVLDVSGAIGGTIALGASLPPPDTGTQPLVASSLASYRAAGSSADTNGRIELTPLTLKQGQCSNDGAVRCLIDSECQSGCLTGDCLYANPDTDGQDTAFTVAPQRFGDPGLGECASYCEGY